MPIIRATSVQQCCTSCGFNEDLYYQGCCSELFCIRCANIGSPKTCGRQLTPDEIKKEVAEYDVIRKEMQIGKPMEEWLKIINEILGNDFIVMKQMRYNLFICLIPPHGIYSLTDYFPVNRVRVELSNFVKGCTGCKKRLISNVFLCCEPYCIDCLVKIMRSWIYDSIPSYICKCGKKRPYLDPDLFCEDLVQRSIKYHEKYAVDAQKQYDDWIAEL